MDYQQIKTEVAEIAQIVASVPEPFRDKCFELLLSHLLGAPGGNGGGDVPDHDSKGRGEGNDRAVVTVVLPHFRSSPSSACS